jgi:uncharacterized protein YciI
MAYVIETRDKAGSAHIRDKHRTEHWDYLYANEPRLLISGPLYAADEKTIIGGLIIIDLPTRAEAERFATEDPFARAGLFESVTIAPFKRGFPRALAADYPDPRHK